MDSEPDGAWTTLRRGFSCDALVNLKLGIFVKLARRSDVSVDDHGFAVVSSRDGDDEPQYAEDIIGKTMHVTAGEKWFVQDLSTGQVSWLEDVLMVGSVSKAFRARSKYGSFISECYHSDSPRGAATVRWSMPYLLFKLFGAVGNTTRFVHHRAAGWERWILSLFSARGDHMRPSLLSMQRRAQPTPMPLSEQVRYDPEYSLSSQGLILFLLSCIVGKSNEADTVDLEDVCREVLMVLIEHFVPESAALDLTFQRISQPCKALVRGSHPVRDARGRLT